MKETHLDTLMTAQIEIEFRRMCYTYVDRGSCWNITALPALFFFVGTEQSCVMSLLNNDERYTRLVVSLEFDARLSDSRQFMLKNVQKLSLRDTVAVQNYPVWFVATGALVEHYKELSDKVRACQFINA